MQFRKTFILCLVLAMIFMGFTGALAAPKSGGILRVIHTEQPEGSIGVPENTRGAGGKVVKMTILEPLVIQLFNGDFVPWLAESFKWSDDYKDCTMNLRKGVKFHDGADFNGQAVKWNWDRITAAKAAGTMEVESLEIVDDYTIVFHLKEANNTWMDSVTVSGPNSAMLMISPKTYKEKGKEWADWHPVGTGPFKFVDYTESQSLEMIKFDEYWGKKPLIDGIKYIYIKDFITAELAFEAGEGDVIAASGHDRDLMNDLLPKNKGYWAEEGPGLHTVIVPPGARENSVWSNLKVREALGWAIDRDKIVKSVYFGLAKAKYTPVYSWQLPYDPNFKGREYNPEKARQLLAEAGFPNGFKTTVYCQFLTCGNDSAAIQAFLGDIGIQANIEEVSVGKWIEMETNGWEDGLLITFVGPETFRAQVFRDWATPTGPNWYNGIWYNTLYRPKELQELTKGYFAIGDIEKEKERGRKIMKVLYDHACVIPLWEMQGAMIFQPYVKNENPELWALSAALNWRPLEGYWLDK